MPGVAYVDHGARHDPIIPGVIDRGGAINCISGEGITSEKCVGQATTGYLVEVTKLSGDEMDQWKVDYPEAFEREIQICVPRASSGHDLQLALKIWPQLKFDASVIAPSTSPSNAATIYEKLATKKFPGLTAVFDWTKPSSSLPKA